MSKLGFFIYWQKFSSLLWFFGIEYIPQEGLNKIRDQLITRNIFRMQDNYSIMCGFYCIAFIKYMLVGKSLLDYTDMVSPNDYKKNDKIIYKYFEDNYDRRSKSWVQIKKNWWNKKLDFRWNKK